MLLSTATLATLLLIAQTPAPPSPPMETLIVSGAAGRGSTWDDEGAIGPGWSAGAALEWRFHPRLSAVFDVERLPHERDTPGLRFSGHTVFASAGVKYRFTSQGITPFVSGGVGVARYVGALLVRFEPPPVSVSRSSTSSAVHAAGGLEIPIGARFAIAPAVRIRFCQPNDDFAPWATIGATVNAGLRF